MRALISILSLLVLGPVGASWAQLAAPGEAGVAMGHVHLMVRDLEASKKFFAPLGGIPGKFGATETVKFPGVFVFLRQGDPTGGSVGTIVNHVGFQVPSLQEAVAKLEGAGIKTFPGPNPQQVYIYAPGEMRIAIVEVPSSSVPIAFHHVHFYVAEAGSENASPVDEIKAWYVKLFGAKPGKRGNLETADLPGASLTLTKSPTPTVGIKGRVLDHIGFEIKDLEAFCKKLEASGVKLDRPYSKRPDGLGLAFLTDPWGTYIELTEGLNRL